MTLSSPYVSVVIPMFNRNTTIRRAVDSALAQSIRDLEVIVVDDASYDDSASIVAAIDDPRLQLLRRERNGGASAARNAGIAASKGSLIAFLDSDDEWFPDKLDIQIAALQSVPHAGVSCTGVEMHLLDHGITRLQPLDDSPDWARRLAMDCNLSPGTTQLTRRAIFDKIGPLDETFQRFEDWDWLIRYTRTGSIVVVKEPLARVYNRRARLGEVVEHSAKLLLAKHRNMFNALDPADRRKAVADIWLQAVGTYAFEGKLGAVLRPFSSAFVQRPLHTVSRLVAGVGTVMRGRVAGAVKGRD